MYEVINKENGQRIALCEQPRYVRIKEQSGAFIQCSRKEAEGIAVNGEVYSLNGRLTGRPETEVHEIDGGKLMAEVEKQAQDLLNIKAALCELDLAGGE